MLALRNMKKYNNKYKSFAVITVSLFALAPLAHADIEAGTNVAAVGTLQVKAPAVQIQTTAAPVKGVRMEGGVNTAGGVKMEDGMEMEEHGSTTNAHGLENAEMHANEHAQAALENAELHVDLDDETEAQEAGDVDEPMDVHSEADFKHFVSHKSKTDAHIKSVDVKGGKVAVEYEEAGKWFGFIKGHVNLETTADVNGNVQVKYPWYHVFVSGTHSSASLEAAIAHSLGAHMKGMRDSSGKIATTVSVPDLFDIVTNNLKDASVSAESSTQVKAN